MKIYVIRHGEVETNVKKQINGRNEESLNNNGVIQAKSKRNEINKLKIDLIICSPLKRTKETCIYVNEKNIPVIYDERIIERDSKSMTYESAQKLSKDIWYDENKEIVYTDSEGFKRVLDRVYEFLDEIKEKYSDKDVLIITHGDICKAIYKYFNNDMDIPIYNFDQENCEIIKYEC